MNTRLTKEMRKEIKGQLLSDKFAKRKSVIADKLQAFALKVYETKFTFGERRILNRLPDGWFREEAYVGARLGHFDFHISLNKKRLRVPYETSHYMLAVANDHPLTKTYAELKEEQNAIEKEEAELKREIDAVLFSVVTANKLVEVWPEIKKKVTQVCKTFEDTANLPAPRVDFLNKTLGLTKAA